MKYFNRVRTIRGARFGITHDLVHDGGEPYLERWIVWFGYTLRLHKFHKGDDDRAFHDHPWWFVTLPLSSYLEHTPQGTKTVARLRPHFRRANHRHIVQLIEGRPVHTFILTGRKSKEWGFWEENDFIHHEQWNSTSHKHASNYAMNDIYALSRDKGA